MKPKPFCPAGYEPVNDWIHKETGRRGFRFERNAMPDDVYRDIFDDLANHLGNFDDDGAKLSVCNVNGRIEPVPVEKWRQPNGARLTEISTGYINFHHGFMAGTTDAKVFVRADLRVPVEADVIEGVAVRVEDDRGDAPEPAVAPDADTKVAAKRARTVPFKKSSEIANRIRSVVAEAKRRWSDLKKAPSTEVMAQEMCRETGKCHGYAEDSVRQILDGRYPVQTKSGIKGYRG